MFSYLFIIITAVTLKAFTNRSHEITSTARQNYSTVERIQIDNVQTLNELKELLRRDIFKRDYLLFFHIAVALCPHQQQQQQQNMHTLLLLWCCI